MEIKFGPAGNSESFYKQGFKHTYQMPAWLHGMGLDAFEYSFGRGVRIKDETAQAIRKQAEHYGIQLSVHAPYFINLANPQPDALQKNIAYFRETSHAAFMMGAKRVVFHPGSCKGMERTKAFALCKERFVQVLHEMDRLGFGEKLVYCPETMGKVNQLGSLEEVLALCTLDERVVPAIDFAHLHARGFGAIRSAADYAHILQAVIDALGEKRARGLHIHFCRIEYSKGGEKMHHRFEDAMFGPEPEPLMQLIAKLDLLPVVICESNGTMAEDAKALQQYYLKHSAYIHDKK
ncbi:MAG: TIM barrel protein [Christensenellales bacterium]